MRIVKLRFTLRGTTNVFEEDFYVEPSLQYQAVFGFKFLRKYRCSDNCADNLISFSLGSQLPSHTSPDGALTIKTDLIYSHPTILSSLTQSFKKDNPLLEHIMTHTMTIPLTSKVTVHKKPYAIPVVLLSKIKAEIQRLMNLEVITKSTSVYASPAFPISKKNGDIRLVFDYRELNSKTVKLGFSN